MRGASSSSSDGGHDVVEGEVVHTASTATSSVPGRMVGEGDAFGLGVHRLSPAPLMDVAQLVPYFMRDFDGKLRGRVSIAAAGTSTLAVLVYDAPSGATRACWEAIHQTTLEREEMLLNGWWVWPELSPETPERLLEFLERIESRTVLFLDHLEWYLDTEEPSLGERVAERLRQLLRDQHRTPVLILGMMPRQHWRSLMEGEDVTDSRRRAQIRSLLGSADIWMPAEMNDDEIATVQVWPDSRMRSAARHCRKGRVIQRLTAAPDLEGRYRHASAAGQAVLRAAIALKNLGHGDWMPAMLLHDAARAHLGAERTAIGSELWFDTALNELTRSGVAGTSPLIPRTGTFGSGAGEYRLDEYVAEIGCRERRAEPTTDELWAAVRDHAALDELMTLARAACHRRLLHVAASLFGRAFELGDYGAVGELADMLAAAGQVEAAAEHYAVLAEAGDRGAIRQAVEMLIAAKRTTAALEWLDRYCAPDRTELLGIAAQAYAIAGRRDQAIACGRWAAARGNCEPMMAIAGMLNEERRLAAALELLSELADNGHHAALSAAAEYIADAHGEDAALEWLQRRIDGQDVNAYVPGAVLLARSRQMEKCVAWFDTAWRSGAPGTAGTAAATFAGLRHFDLVQLYAERAAETGEYESMVETAVLLASAGFYSRASTLFRGAVSAGHHRALAAAARTFAAIGQVSETRHWFEQARSAGVAPALATLVAELAGAGHQEEAIDWYLDEADASADAGLAPIIGIMHNAGRVEVPQHVTDLRAGRDAVGWYRTHTDLDVADVYLRIGEELNAAGLALKHSPRSAAQWHDVHDSEASMLQSAGAGWCQRAVARVRAEVKERAEARERAEATRRGLGEDYVLPSARARVKDFPVPKERAAVLLRAGEMLIEVGRHAEALPLLREAEQWGEARAIPLRALCLARLGNPESFGEVDTLLHQALALGEMSEFAAAAAVLAWSTPSLEQASDTDEPKTLQGRQTPQARLALQAQEAAAAEVAATARKMGLELLNLGARAGDAESLRQLQRRHQADRQGVKAVTVFRTLVERGFCDARELAEGWDEVAVNLSAEQRELFRTYGLEPGGAPAPKWRLAPPDPRAVLRLRPNQAPQRASINTND
ncbi:hypothetical protein [Amycolatopsis sp. NPDC059657]|uniref:hypothetical protein n=1 Tax=Amycolatopsis sp. NPDC059657 TaxID=3346899 RepID=UPI00366E0058